MHMHQRRLLSPGNSHVVCLLRKESSNLAFASDERRGYVRVRYHRSILKPFKMLGDRHYSIDKLDVDFDPSSSQQSFQIRPHLSEKFRPQRVKEMIQNVLSDQLSGKVYANEDMTALTKEIAVIIRDQVKEMEFERYKILVQVVLGEQRGAGVKIGARCMWDSDADNLASADYENDSLFCVTTVFAVFTY